MNYGRAMRTCCNLSLMTLALAAAHRASALAAFACSVLSVTRRQDVQTGVALRVSPPTAARIEVTILSEDVAVSSLRLTGGARLGGIRWRSGAAGSLASPVSFFGAPVGEGR